MKKIILFLLLFFVYANASDLLYLKNNRCVHDLEPYQGHSGWCFTYSVEGYKACDTKAVLDDFQDGYYVNQVNQCVLEPDLAMLQISKNTHNDLMISLAVVFSAAFIFALVSIISF